MSQTAEQALHTIREELNAPTLQERAWNEDMTPQDRRFLLRASGLDPQRESKRWQKLNPLERKRIIETFKNFQQWAWRFTGVFA